ncbi:uncharacterized [Tachysurus ichikawai]
MVEPKPCTRNISEQALLEQYRTSCRQVGIDTLFAICGYLLVGKPYSHHRVSSSNPLLARGGVETLNLPLCWPVGFPSLINSGFVLGAEDISAPFSCFGVLGGFGWKEPTLVKGLSRGNALMYENKAWSDSRRVGKRISLTVFKMKTKLNGSTTKDRRLDRYLRPPVS